MIDKNFSGFDGMTWWMGVIENRKDPLGLGRCQVRIFGIHTDSLSDIPSSDLPWAHPAHSLNNKSFAAPKESDVVFGFFADGRSAQYPIMLGIIPGYETNPATTGSGFHDLREQIVIKYSPKKPTGVSYTEDGSGVSISEANVANPDVLESLRYPHKEDLGKPSITGMSRYDVTNTALQRRKENINRNITTSGGLSWEEPYPPYNTSYPFNQVIETESGHIFELDDTPRGERVAFTHRSGTYTEMFPSGSYAEKITKSKYSIIMSDDHIHIMGRAMITVDSDCHIKVLGDAVIEAGNDLDMKVAGKMNLSVGEDLNIKAGKLNIESESTVDVVSAGYNRTRAVGDISHSGAITMVQDLIKPDDPPRAVAAGIASPDDRDDKNMGIAQPEQIPLPLPGNIIQFDPYTGQAYKESLFKDQTEEGDLVEPKPDANTTMTTSECNYDPNVKTFISEKSQWSIGPKGLNIIKQKEGFRADAYVDPATGAEPITIGYGSTASAIDRPVRLGDKVTKDQAEEYLIYGINKKFLPTLKRVVSIPLTQEMIDALLSLMYNIGGGNFSSSTLVRKLNEKDYCGAGDQFLVWNKANGKVMAGLTTRRQQERDLFLS